MSGVSSQILQIAADYPGIPDVRTLSIRQVRFFYEPLIPGLIKMQIKDRENKNRGK